MKYAIDVLWTPYRCNFQMSKGVINLKIRDGGSGDLIEKFKGGELVQQIMLSSVDALMKQYDLLAEAAGLSAVVDYTSSVLPLSKRNRHMKLNIVFVGKSNQINFPMTRQLNGRRREV